jgi:hypothetical protein
LKRIGQEPISAVRGKIASKGSLPVALAACDEDGLLFLVGEPIERGLDCSLAASARLRTRVLAALELSGNQVTHFYTAEGKHH